MAVRERRGGWQADIFYQGTRYREQFATEVGAVEWEAAARTALAAGHPIPSVSKPAKAWATIAGLLETVIETRWGRGQGADKQANSSIAHAKRFVAFVGPTLSPPAALTQQHVEAFVAHLMRTTQVSGSTINRHLSAISVLTKKALAAGLIPRKLDLPWQNEGSARLRWFTDDEVDAIERTLRHWGRDDIADFFVVLIDTGARTWVEGHRMKWVDISAKPRAVTFWDTKNGDSRTVPLTARAWAAIQRHNGTGKAGPFYGLSRRNLEYVFGRLQDAHPQLADAVWYTARHTFASRLVQRGVNLYRVKVLMGHRSIETTMGYAKLAPQDLIDAVAVLEPTRELAPPPSPALDVEITPELLALARRLQAEMNRDRVAPLLAAE